MTGSEVEPLVQQVRELESAVAAAGFLCRVDGCDSLLRRGLFVLWGSFCVVGRLGRKKKGARFLFLSIIDILMGIPSGSLCGGESGCDKNYSQHSSRVK